MNKEKLLAEHPALYNEIFALGKTAGVTEERDRVEAIMVFNDVDPKACAEAIASGKPLTSKQMAEFSLKAVTAGRKKDLKDDSAGEATTGEAADTSAEAENKELRAFAEKVKKQTAFFSETK